MKSKLLILLILIGCQVLAQNSQHFASIGNFKTTGGAVIPECKIGYRTLGKLNTEKSNTVLWLTWYTGTSEVVSSVVPGIVDTSQYYVIIVDALGNGVSSSPSNTKDFPAITVHDMVNTQYELLTNNLEINHINSVMGISMGAMQALEWMVAYPTFMDRAISIVGSPKQSFFDLLLWNTELDMINQALETGKKEEMELTRKLVADIQQLELYTPDYFIRTQNPENLNIYRTSLYAAENYHISDLRAQLQAMINQDIYQSAGESTTNINEVIKSKVLLIVALRDHMVNPQNAITLSKQISCELFTVDNDCGHNLLECGSDKVRGAISSFLNK